MILAFYISGHGLGHSTRDIEVIKALVARRPDARVIVRTAAQRWIFDRTAPSTVEIQPFEADTGVVQIDSLQIDELMTARRAAAFYRDFDRRVTDEAEWLRRIGATMVLGDIPPLAFAAAARADVPSIAISNFTWDWIYDDYPAFAVIAPDVVPIVRDAYAAATRALRLPLHGGFEPMRAVVRDIPLVARVSERDRDQTRRTLGVTDDRPVVLSSFAHGADIPIDSVVAEGRLQVINATHDLPSEFLHQDLVAASDVVLSKPGYGIVSECIANGTAFLYTARGRFAEYDMFVGDMPRVLRCRHLSQEDLLAGRWAGAVDALLAQPAPPEQLPVDGADVAATTLLAFEPPFS